MKNHLCLCRRRKITVASFVINFFISLSHILHWNKILSTGVLTIKCRRKECRAATPRLFERCWKNVRRLLKKCHKCPVKPKWGLLGGQSTTWIPTSSRYSLTRRFISCGTINVAINFSKSGKKYGVSSRLARGCHYQIFQFFMVSLKPARNVNCTVSAIRQPLAPRLPFVLGAKRRRRHCYF